MKINESTIPLVRWIMIIKTIHREFRQTTLYRESWRLCRSFINLIEWRERRVTCQQLIGDIKHTWKKYRIFSRVLLRYFSGLEILVWHRSLYDKSMLHVYSVRLVTYGRKFITTNWSQLKVIHGIEYRVMGLKFLVCHTCQTGKSD